MADSHIRQVAEGKVGTLEVDMEGARVEVVADDCQQEVEDMGTGMEDRGMGKDKGMVVGCKLIARVLPLTVLSCSNLLSQV